MVVRRGFIYVDITIYIPMLKIEPIIINNIEAFLPLLTKASKLSSGIIVNAA
jgi:hypothetical protein